MNSTHTKQLSPIASRAWKRLEREFPSWAAHLNNRDGELEFVLPAPSGSAAGHLVVFSQESQIWVRFSPPYMCYATDDDNEMVSLVKQLTTDSIVFKVTMNGKEWVETTLTKAQEKAEFTGRYSVRYVSWSGKFDG